jgi:hypothetical protein
VADATAERRLVRRLRHVVADATAERRLVRRLRHVVADATAPEADDLSRA